MKVVFKYEMFFIHSIFTLKRMESVADDYKTLKEIGLTDETARYIINRYIIHDNHQDLEYWVNWYIEVFFREKLEKDHDQYEHSFKR